MRKVYVEVNAEFMPDGMVIPLSFTWDDGREYQIDKLIDRVRAASLKAGGVGMRYTVRVGGKETYMWLEDNCNRWFIEGK